MFGKNEEERNSANLHRQTDLVHWPVRPTILRRLNVTGFSPSLLAYVLMSFVLFLTQFLLNFLYYGKPSSSTDVFNLFLDCTVTRGNQCCLLRIEKNQWVPSGPLLHGLLQGVGIRTNCPLTKEVLTSRVALKRKWTSYLFSLLSANSQKEAMLLYQK